MSKQGACKCCRNCNPRQPVQCLGTLFCLAILGFLVVGCGNLKVVLPDYKPVAAVTRASGMEVVLVKFTTARQTREIGDIKNSYGMKLGTVSVDEDIGSWIGNALAVELAAAGYDVKRIRESPDKGPPRLITGQVLDMQVDTKTGIDTVMRTKIQVSITNRVIMDDIFIAKKNNVLSYSLKFQGYRAYFKESIQKSLRLTLEDIMRGAVPRIVDAIESASKTESR